MTQRIWDSFLTARDRQVFAASGYGAQQDFGKRPALVVVDVNYFFCGDRPEPSSVDTLFSVNCFFLCV